MILQESGDLFRDRAEEAVAVMIGQHPLPGRPWGMPPIRLNNIPGKGDEESDDRSCLRQ